MNDRTKACLSFFLLFLALTLPLVVGVVSALFTWQEINAGCSGFWNCAWEMLKYAAIPALITFVALFLAAGVLLITIKEPSWLLVWLPGVLGTVYALSPISIPGPIDNGVAFAGGALASFALWLKKQPDAPRWVIWPITIASLYTFIGGLVPFEVDEFLVYLITGVGTYFYYRHQQGQIEPPPEPPPGDDSNVIDGEFHPSD